MKLSAKTNLAFQLAKRDVLSRYRGSLFGVLWSAINPLLLLAVYGFVFSVVLETRWGIENESHGTFAIMLFSGLIIHAIFAEVLVRTPLSILHHANYVKKVVFPLEILPIVTILAATFQSLISFAILFVAGCIFMKSFSLTVLLLPIILLPFIILLSGVGWFLASLGTYLRDITQMMGLFATISLFISPVFYPVSKLPAAAQFMVSLNPISVIVENIRNIMLFGKLPDFTSMAVYSVVAAILFLAGYLWFMKTKKGFADVI